VIEPAELTSKLKQAFPDAEIDLDDLTGTKDHYEARVVSAAFEGKNPLQQHRLVYEALKEEMKGAIHALALKTYSPALWAQKDKK